MFQQQLIITLQLLH